MKSHFLAKQDALMSHFVTRMRREFQSPATRPGQTVLFVLVAAFFGRIGLPPTVTGWAASCGDGP